MKWDFLFNALVTSPISLFLVFIVGRILLILWIFPMQTYWKIKRCGFNGPTPSFPMGNIAEMKKKGTSSSSCGSIAISHDIHSTVFPYFARWQKLHGKVFVYWQGIEPFLYIAEPEFLRRISAGVLGKTWGKPNVFKRDREPLFGNGLVMAEGDEWAYHRHVVSPAFSPANLKAMASLMVESTTKMVEKWETLINSGKTEIDVKKDISLTAGEIIGKMSFGMRNENCFKISEKLREIQNVLFNCNRYVGLPFGKLMCITKTLEAKKLRKEIKNLLLSIITDRENFSDGYSSQDLLGLLIEEKRMNGRKITTKQIVDECKTFFFGGHDTTALLVTWSLLVLAMHPQWQMQLREEIREVIGDEKVDSTMLPSLKKMGWVMNEVLRLYSPAPNVQRQTRHKILVGDLMIPKGTNLWIDVVSMHHDEDLWGTDAKELKPERFKDDACGGCKHKMGFLPFGFGGRMCIGKNLTMMEGKIFLTIILSMFSVSISPKYCHSPTVLLTLRPKYGMPLIFQSL